MRVRNITTCALGLAAALTLVPSVTMAQSQDTTKLRKPSEQRISISKGEVAAPVVRVDTVYVTRYDTVRVDNTIVRVDTVTVAAPVPYVAPKIKGPMYWGLFGGATRPYGNIDRVYTNGFHAGGLLGWEMQHGLIGVRFDGSMSQLGREETVNLPASNIGSGTPLMLVLAGDLKIKPINLGGWALYGIGGFNYNRYRGIALASDPDGTCTGFSVRPGDCFQNASPSWSDKFGFNFGLGTDFHIGSQDMFIEYRWLATRANSANSYTNPISIGVRYF